jgi:hypothetical protein
MRRRGPLALQVGERLHAKQDRPGLPHGTVLNLAHISLSTLAPLVQRLRVSHDLSILLGRIAVSPVDARIQLLLIGLRRRKMSAQRPP